jgi:ornithine carbamoyltransferase
LYVTDFTAEEIMETFHLAREVKARLKARKDYKPFKDHTLASIFAKPSARTRVSFETSFLGGHVLFQISSGIRRIHVAAISLAFILTSSPGNMAKAD